MRKREVLKQVWMNFDEANELKLKSQKANINESEMIRSLVKNYEPREKPDDRFYEALKDLRAIGNNLNQLARKANSLGFIDETYYKKEAEKWNSFIINIKEEFLLPVAKIPTKD